MSMCGNKYILCWNARPLLASLSLADLLAQSGCSTMRLKLGWRVET